MWKLGLGGSPLEITGQDLGLIGGPYLVKQVQYSSIRELRSRLRLRRSKILIN